MTIYSFKNGDTLRKYNEALVACFSERRKVLGTAPLNGGRQDGLKWIFNHGGEFSGEMRAPSYEEHVAAIAGELGLDPRLSSGMSTAASMDNASIKTLEYGEMSVTAVVTGGIDVNAGRVGDIALWHEDEGRFKFVAGTINILLFIDADLTEGALARSLVTCTEAKTAALQELLVPSRYSSGIATGSGTDGTIIVANPLSPTRLTEAGKHFKLGEMIGRAVIPAVKEALFLETGLCANRQMDVFSRMGRFGATKDALAERALRKGVAYERFSERIGKIARDEGLVSLTSLYAHILDQLSWGMLPGEQALRTAGQLLALMGMDPSPLSFSENALDSMAEAYIEGLLSKLQ